MNRNKILAYRNGLMIATRVERETPKAYILQHLDQKTTTRLEKADPHRKLFDNSDEAMAWISPVPENVDYRKGYAITSHRHEDLRQVARMLEDAADRVEMTSDTDGVSVQITGGLIADSSFLDGEFQVLISGNLHLSIKGAI